MNYPFQSFVKSILLTLFSLAIFINVQAQVFDGINYQAIIRDVNGKALSQQRISVRFVIRENATEIYAERHIGIQTNILGLINLRIGGGSPEQSYIFNNIDWSQQGSYWIEVEVDENGGSSFNNKLGQSQLKSVPFALYAKDVENKDDADADPQNEIQGLVLNGNNLEIVTGGGQAILDISAFRDNTDRQKIDYVPGINALVLSDGFDNGNPFNDTVYMSSFALNADFQNFLTQYAADTTNTGQRIQANTNRINQSTTSFDQRISADSVRLASHLAADNDLDSNNERITNMTLNGASLEITEGSAADSVNLSRFDQRAAVNNLNQIVGRDTSRLNVHLAQDQDLDPNNERINNTFVRNDSLLITEGTQTYGWDGSGFVDSNGVNSNSNRIRLDSLRMNNLEVRYKATQDSVKALADSSANYNTRINTNAAGISAINSDLNNVKSDLRQTEDSLRIAYGRIKTAQDSLNTAYVRLKGTQDSVKTLADSSVSYNTRINSNRSDLSNLNAAFNSDTARLSGHISADQDLSSTNELQNLSLTSDSILLSNGTGIPTAKFADTSDVSDIESRLSNLSDSAATNYALIVADTARLSVVESRLTTHLSNDDDSSTTNELVTDLGFSNDSITITDAGGKRRVDVSSLNQSAAVAALQSKSGSDSLRIANDSIRLNAVDARLTTHLTNDDDSSTTNELITDLGFSNDSITITDAGGKRRVDVSGLNQSAAVAALQSKSGSDSLRIANDSIRLNVVDARLTTHLTNDDDSSTTNELVTDLGFSNDSITITDAGGKRRVDVSSLNQSAAVAALQSKSGSDSLRIANDSIRLNTVDARLTTHISNDEDSSITNELIDTTYFENNTAYIVESGDTNEIDLTALNGSASLKQTQDSLQIAYNNIKSAQDSLNIVYGELKGTQDSLGSAYGNIKSAQDSLRNLYGYHDTLANDVNDLYVITYNDSLLFDSSIAALNSVAYLDTSEANELIDTTYFENNIAYIVEAGDTSEIDLTALNGSASLKQTQDSLQTAYVNIKSAQDSLNIVYGDLKGTQDSLGVAYGNIRNAQDSLNNLYVYHDSLAADVVAGAYKDSSETNELIDTTYFENNIAYIVEAGDTNEINLAVLNGNASLSQTQDSLRNLYGYHDTLANDVNDLYIITYNDSLLFDSSIAALNTVAYLDTSDGNELIDTMYLAGNQLIISEASGAVTDTVDLSSFSGTDTLSLIRDADGNTYVTTELSTNEDKIRFFRNGSNALTVEELFGDNRLLVNGFLSANRQVLTDTIRGLGTSNVVYLNNIIPRGNGSFTLGLATNRWKNIYADTIQIANGAGAGKVLMSDADGNATWQNAPSGADDLGNHTATQSLQLNNNYISNDGDNEGLRIDNDGSARIVGGGFSAEDTAFTQFNFTSRQNVARINQRSSINSANGNEFFFYKARGTASSPVQVQDNDIAVSFFSDFRNSTGTSSSVFLQTEVDGPYNSLVPTQVSLFTSDSAGVRRGQLVMRSSGNVGIGTAFPGAKLDVSGRLLADTLQSNNLRISSGAANGRVLTSDANGYATWQPVAAASTPGLDSVLAVSGDAGNDSITNVRMIGIGTTSPTASLDIQSSDNFSISVLNTNSSTSDKKGVFSAVSGTGSGQNMGLYGGASNSSTTNYGVYGEATGTQGTKYAIYGTTTGSNAWAGYFNQGNVYINDNLGIGVTAPARRLDVGGDMYVDSLFTDSLYAVLAHFDSLRIANSYSFPTSAGTNGQVLQIDGSGNVRWATPTAANQIWDTNSTTAYLQQNKNVSIGIEDSALSRLQIDGEFNISNVNTSGQMAIGQNTYFDSQMKHYDNGAASATFLGKGFMQFHTYKYGAANGNTGAPDNYMYMDTNGLGIGTSTPHAPLHIHTGNQERVLVVHENSDNDHQFYGFGYNGGHGLKYHVAATIVDHIFYAGTSSSTSLELFRITGDGKIGIGESTPTGQLEIGGGINGRKIVFSPGNNDHQFIGFGLNNDVLRYQVRNNVSDHVFFAGTSSTTSRELLRITGDGFVGIGTSTPTSSLEVVGESVLDTIYSDTMDVTKANINQLSINGVFTLPNVDGSPQQVLQTDGSGNVSWATVASQTDTLPLIADSDKNTYVSVETTTDNIDFVQRDTTFWRMDRHTLVPLNSGKGVFIGENAGQNITNSSNNSVFIGWQAGQTTASGFENVGIGLQALRDVTTGGGHVAIGAYTLRKVTTALDNTAVGDFVLSENTSGHSNSAFGKDAMRNNTTGVSNSAFGEGALTDNLTGGQNSAFGRLSLSSSTSGSDNVAFGYNALSSDTNGLRNTAIGTEAMRSHLSGANNVAVGKEALGNNIAGSGNVALGYQAGQNETGSNSLYIDNSNTSTPLIYGQFDNDVLVLNGDVRVRDDLYVDTANASSGLVLTSDANGKATWQAAAGGDTLSFIQDDDADTKIQLEKNADEDMVRFDLAGTERFRFTKEGQIEVFDGKNGTYLGGTAGDKLTSGSRNTLIGYEAGANLTSTGDNTYVGFNAGKVSSGSGNTSVGSYSGDALTSGKQNALLGFQAGTGLTTGSNNLILGYNAGRVNTSGEENVFLGGAAGETNTGKGNVFIGFSAGKNETGDNKLYIENSDGSKPLIFGDFANDSVYINGDFEIRDNFYYTSGASNGKVLTSDANGLATWQDAPSSPWSSLVDTIYSTGKYISIGSASPMARFSVIDTLTSSTFESGVWNSIHSTNTTGNAFGFKTSLTGEVDRSYGIHSTVTGSIEAFAKSYGVYSTITSSGNGASPADFYAGYFKADGTHSPSGSEYWGIYAEASGARSNYAIWATASGGSSDNFAGYFDNGNVQINDQLIVGGSFGNAADSALNVKGGIKTDYINIYEGAGSGKVLTSDADGNATWQTTASSPWSTSVDTIYADTNWIGIGTSNPDARMSILQTDGDYAFEAVVERNTSDPIIGIFGGAAGAGTGQKYGAYFSSIYSGGAQNIGAYAEVDSASTNNIGFYGFGYTQSGTEARGVQGQATGLGTNIGLFGKATGGSTNYAAYFDTGYVYVTDTMIIPTNAGAGKVLTSDASGYATWQSLAASTDTAWSHNMVQNIETNGFYISGDGDNEGIHVDDDGDVTIGASTGFSKLGVRQATGDVDINVTAQSGTAELGISSYGSSESGILSIHRAGGTWSSSTSLANNDDIFQLQTSLYNGTSSTISYPMSISVDGVNSGNIGTRIDFQTKNSSGGTTNDALSILENGQVVVGRDFATSTTPQLQVAGEAWVDSLRVRNTTSAAWNTYGIYNWMSGTGSGRKTAVLGTTSGGSGDGVAIRGHAGDAGINKGVEGSASGGTENWAGYFGTGNVYVGDTLQIATGTPAAGQVLTALDADGNAAWTTISTTPTCPAGMVDVNGDYCIDKDERTAAIWFVADSICVDSGYTLATYGEWYGAATQQVANSIGVNDMEDADWEWTSNMSQNNVMVVGNSTAGSPARRQRAFRDPETDTAVYRCVKKL